MLQPRNPHRHKQVAALSRQALSLLFVLSNTVGGGCGDASISTSPPFKHTNNIIGGVDEAGWPGVGAIVLSDAQQGYQGVLCTGSLLTPQWVLSAAHCVFAQGLQRDPRSLWFVTEQDVSSAIGARPPGAFVRIDATVIHPGFDPGASEHDLALLHLAEAAPAAAVYNIQRLAMTVDDVDKPLVFVGYGASDGEEISDLGHKRSAKLQILDFSESGFRSHSEDQGLCVGDSGGPAFSPVDLADPSSEAKIVGVNTGFAGLNCTGPYYQLRVDFYASWIDATVQAPLPNCGPQGLACRCAEACAEDGLCDDQACPRRTCSETWDTIKACADDEDCQIEALNSCATEHRPQIEALLACAWRNCQQALSAAAPDCIQRACLDDANACSDETDPSIALGDDVTQPENCACRQGQIPSANHGVLFASALLLAFFSFRRRRRLGSR